MSYDEFAFFNQQLAAMLRDGIPLEGALKRLCAEMRAGSLRSELQALGDDLARGVPITEALKTRKLPEIYKRLVLVGVKGGSLPDALTMVADHYHRQNSLWLRLKGLMVYPLIVLFMTFVISCVFIVVWEHAGKSYWFLLMDLGEGRPLPAAAQATLPLVKNMWIFPLFFGLLFLAAVAIWLMPGIHNYLRWRVPAFKEAALSRVASSIHLLLKGGVPLPDAIGLTQQLENSRTSASDLGQWRKNLADGMTRFQEIAGASRAFPPLFVWLVSNGGEDVTSGFARAAEIYRARAEHRAEAAMYTALPAAVLFLGAIVLSQAYLLFSGFLVIVDLLNNLGA